LFTFNVTRTLKIAKFLKILQKKGFLFAGKILLFSEVIIVCSMIFMNKLACRLEVSS